MRSLLRALVLPLLALPATPVAPAYADHAPACGGRHPTIVGTDEGERIRGTAGDDVIAGLGGRDTIFGLGGDDVICGGGGQDRLEGGPGNDRLYGGQDGGHADQDGEVCLRGDELDGGDGDDLLRPGKDSRRSLPGPCGGLEELRFRHGTGGVRVDLRKGIATGQGRDRIMVDQALSIVGSDEADVVLGDERQTWFEGRRGDDYFLGRGGPDWAIENDPRNGDDRYVLGGGHDRPRILGGADVVRTGPARDYVSITSDDAVDLDAGSGSDLVNRYDLVHGDRVVGGGGKDFLRMTTADDQGRAAIDARTGVLTFGGSRASVPGFEVWTFTARMPLLFQGTDGRDEVHAAGYSATRARLTAYLRGGDDVATGANFADDYVNGGRGRDTADLGTGDDTCVRVEDGPC